MRKPAAAAACDEESITPHRRPVWPKTAGAVFFIAELVGRRDRPRRTSHWLSITPPCPPLCRRQVEVQDATAAAYLVAAVLFLVLALGECAAPGGGGGLADYLGELYM